MHIRTKELIEDHIDDSYRIVEYTHALRVFGKTTDYYVELQHGGDETLIVVREFKPSIDGPDRLIGMPYTAVGYPDILDRLERALETLAYHNQSE